VLGGILGVLRNRASWRAMPVRFGNDNTAYKRYRLWSDSGFWDRLFNALHSGTDEGTSDVSL
jgi:transposase